MRLLDSNGLLPTIGYFCLFFSFLHSYSAEQSSFSSPESSIVIILPDNTWFSVSEQQYPSLRSIGGSLIANINQIQPNEEISVLLPESFYGIQQAEILSLFDIVNRLYAKSSLFGDKEFLEAIKVYLQQFGPLTAQQITQYLVNLKVLAHFFNYQELVNKLHNLIIVLQSPLAERLGVIHLNVVGTTSLNVLNQIVANNIITRNEFLEWDTVFATIAKIRIISFIMNYTDLFNAMDDLKAILGPLYELEQMKKTRTGNLSDPQREKLAELQLLFERKVKEFTGYDHPTFGEYEQVVDFFLYIFKPQPYITNFSYDRFKELKKSLLNLNKQYTM